LSPLRIGAHNGAPEWGGAEIAVARLLQGLQERGHAVRFWCGRAVVAKRARDFDLDTPRLHVGGDVALHHALRVSSALKGWDADVLVAGTFRKLLHLTLGAGLAGVPVVARVGLSTDLPRNLKYRWLFRNRIAHTVVNSQGLKAAYLRALPELPADRISVVYKGVEPPDDLPSRAAARAALGLDADARVVGGVGRMVTQKRFDRWLHVLSELPGDVTGVLVGDGPLRPDLHKRAADLGVADRLRFTGFLPSVWPVLPALDLLLLTSDRESMANVMLEGMAAGVPTVSTPVDGSDEALATEMEEERVGVVTSDFSARALVRAAGQLLDDEAQLASLSERARSRSREHFSAESSVTRWEEVLAAVARSV
jgi:glycosyltransferase involved in cell wall biosynthesis